MAIAMQLLTGPLVTACLDDLASLRLEIFREFPYLYDGVRDGELRYLGLYAETPDALVVTVTDAGKTIGAATGIPLRYETQEMISSFTLTGYPGEPIYYVGELLFYPEYRNRGLGQRLLSLVEERVRSLGKYPTLTCATVERPQDHPLRPPDYTPIERFLARTGFALLPGVTTRLTWREIDGSTPAHVMNFWSKESMA